MFLPAKHHSNPLECAILTFKKHFISILSTFDYHYGIAWFLIQLWHSNLFQSSFIHPSLSSYACLFGNNDYSFIPLAPSDTKVVADRVANIYDLWLPWLVTINPHPVHNMHLIYWLKQYMAENTVCCQWWAPTLDKQCTCASKPYQTLFSIIRAVTPSAFLHSTKSPINKHNPLKAP